MKKKDTIFSSSQQSLYKWIVLLLTFGISIMASLMDTKACYVTILVQACNNVYDFFTYTNNIIYNDTVRRESITVIICAVIAVILSIVSLLEIYAYTEYLRIKLLGILMVALPLIIVYGDYKLNIKKENQLYEVTK